MQIRKYRPSNGAEGMDFMAEYCDQCKRNAAFQAGNGDSCPIAAATMVYNIDDPQYPKEWIVDNDGPCCTAFDAID